MVYASQDSAQRHSGASLVVHVTVPYPGSEPEFATYFTGSFELKDMI